MKFKKKKKAEHFWNKHGLVRIDKNSNSIIANKGRKKND